MSPPVSEAVPKDFDCKADLGKYVCSSRAWKNKHADCDSKRCPYHIHYRLLGMTDLDCNPQQSSLLFTKLPPELRVLVYKFAFAEVDRDEIATSKYWYRPEYAHHRIIHTELLQTCRKIYLEAAEIPLLSVSVYRHFATDPKRSPGEVNERDVPKSLDYRIKKHFKIVPEDHRKLSFPYFEPSYHPHTVQLIAQMFQLEMGSYIQKWGHFLCQEARPQHLIVTVRHTDWWNWEYDQNLGLMHLPHKPWKRYFKVPNSVKKLTLELETRFGRKGQLDDIVNRGTAGVPPVKEWKFEMDDQETGDKTDAGRNLVWDAVNVTPETYIGSASIGRTDGGWYNHHNREENGGVDNLKEGEMMFYVVKINFVPDSRPTFPSWRRESEGELSTSSAIVSPRRESSSSVSSLDSISRLGGDYFPPALPQSYTGLSLFRSSLVTGIPVLSEDEALTTVLSSETDDSLY